MAKKKIKFTRPELKRQRDALQRFERYLPMLKLKQQQLQLMLRQIAEKRKTLTDRARTAQAAFDAYAAVLSDTAGVDVRGSAEPTEINTAIENVAGVKIPVFQSVTFPEVTYSLFGTPAWVDATLSDLKALNAMQAELETVDKQYALLHRELTKIVQRVNLFEKVKIPEVKEAIRKIQIQLGDAMTAAVGRAKIAKSKLDEAEEASDHLMEEEAA